MDANSQFAKQPLERLALHVAVAADSAAATVLAAVAVDTVAAVAAEIVAAAVVVVTVAVAAMIDVAEIVAAVAVTKTATKIPIVSNFWRPARFEQVSFFVGGWLCGVARAPARLGLPTSAFRSGRFSGSWREWIRAVS